MVQLIREFASSRSQEINRVSNVSDKIREHLMCLYYWRDCDCRNHWEGEIFSFIPVMQKLKGTHKFLSYKLIYENLFLNWADTYNSAIRTYVEKLMYKEKNLPKIRNIDRHNLYNFMNEFYTNVSEILSTDGSMTKKEVYSLIETLLSEYPYTIEK